jgi:hypothetical protein
MDRSYLAGRGGDARNALLAAIGYNFRLLLAGLAVLLASPPHHPDLPHRSRTPVKPCREVT